MSVKYYEDLSVGESHELGERTVTRDEILWFAELYDPQPFHVDEEAAAESVFDGVVASGWHTVCLVNRLLVDGHLIDVANMGGRGIDDLRFYRPLHPGTTLSGRVEVVATERPERHDDRGYVTYLLEAFDDEGERLLSMTAELLIRRRAAA